MRKNKATILVIKIQIKLLKYEWKILTGQNSGYDTCVNIHLINLLNEDWIIFTSLEYGIKGMIDWIIFWLFFCIILVRVLHLLYLGASHHDRLRQWSHKTNPNFSWSWRWKLQFLKERCENGPNWKDKLNFIDDFMPHSSWVWYFEHARIFLGFLEINSITKELASI